MAEFSGNLPPCGPVGLTLLLRHGGPVLAAVEWAGLSGQNPVAFLGIGVPESVRIAEVHLESLVFEPFEMFDIAEFGRDQGAAAGYKLHDMLKHVALFQCRNWHGTRPTAFGPACLQRDMVAAYRGLRLELHRLLAAQAEGRLQQQRSLDVRAFDRFELGGIESLGAVTSYLTVFGYAIMGVVAVDDIGLVDLLGPPAQPGQPVADAGVGGVGIKPLLYQSVDMFGFEGGSGRQFVAEIAEIVRHSGQAALAVGLGAERAIFVTLR